MSPELLIAQKSLIWHYEDTYTFLWNHYVVLVKYNRDSGHTMVLSTHDDEHTASIYNFLHSQLHPWMEETRLVDEESWD